MKICNVGQILVIGARSKVTQLPPLLSILVYHNSKPQSILGRMCITFIIKRLANNIHKPVNEITVVISCIF